MEKFRYSMQSILNIKMKMETQAKQEFSAARAALDAEEAKLKGLIDRRTGYEEKAKVLLAGILDLRAVEENREAILCMDGYIEEQRKQTQRAEKQLEQARRRMAEAMMERKTHETLKEKAFQQFLLELKREEGKEVDELTSYTYGQRSREGAG